MERRHQVFISSTFVDLKEERKEIIQTLLEMDCIPAGMEMFPAANEDQLTLIKGVIDECDYYLIVVGGRYGSIDEAGISYTEQEYDYAVSQGIPVMGFVPSNPDLIPQGKTDKNDAAAAKLAEFKAKVQTKMTKEYSSPEDLGGKVARSLSQLRKTHPRPGWVRGDQAMTPEVRAEIAELKAAVARFEKEQAEGSAGSAETIDETFAHGSETIELSLIHKGYYSYKHLEEQGTLDYTWDDLIELLGPFMLDEAPEPVLRKTLNQHMLHDVQEDVEGWENHWSNQAVEISDRSWGSVTVQLRALGVISTGSKKRTVSDKAVYWKLTPAGDRYLVALRAVPHDPNHAPKRLTDEAPPTIAAQ
ncbi:DUF4062 domain-containing protein [Frondihabitans peucedani]|uniref:DUF4062 domain-containing protein n=1 Tax=Frondihabitans peucedani TaxID=598626 RepID=A0ABP8E1I2_9MICO